MSYPNPPAGAPVAACQCEQGDYLNDGVRHLISTEAGKTTADTKKAMNNRYVFSVYIVVANAPLRHGAYTGPTHAEWPAR